MSISPSSSASPSPELPPEEFDSLPFGIFIPWFRSEQAAWQERRRRQRVVWQESLRTIRVSLEPLVLLLVKPTTTEHASAQWLAHLERLRRDDEEWLLMNEAA
jgi:hypothetical protein